MFEGQVQEFMKLDLQCFEDFLEDFSANAMMGQSRLELSEFRLSGASFRAGLGIA